MRQTTDFTSLSVVDAAKRLGERLRLARKSRKKSLAELELICRIHRTTLGRLERGDTGVSVGVFLTVLEALNELADVELVVSQPSTPKYARAVKVPILERDF